MIRLLIYSLSLITTTFAVSGINLESIIKKNHIWEARILIILLIISITYLVANFIIEITNLNIM